jgi:hypothetical protein
VDDALPAAVVLGFGGIFAVIVVGASIQLRRVAKNPSAAAEEAETGALEAVDPPTRK